MCVCASYLVDEPVKVILHCEINSWKPIPRLHSTRMSEVTWNIVYRSESFQTFPCAEPFASKYGFPRWEYRNNPCNGNENSIGKQEKLSNIMSCWRTSYPITANGHHFLLNAREWTCLLELSGLRFVCNSCWMVSVFKLQICSISKQLTNNHNQMFTQIKSSHTLSFSRLLLLVLRFV